MTERTQRGGDPWGLRRATGMGPTGASPTGDVPITLDSGLVGRLAEVAVGRVLVIDYLVTRPSWSLPTAELSAHLQQGVPRGAVRIATLEGVECVADARLTPVLREAGVHLRPVVGAVLGQLEIRLHRPLVWLDFLSSTAARRP